MATAVIMPKQGQSVESCIITKWFKKPGDSIAQGDILFSYETDKASFDLESPASGILLEAFFKDGDEVAVLANVAVVGLPGEPTEAFKQADPNAPSEKKSNEISVSQSNSIIDVKTVDPIAQGRIKISPKARKIALSRNIDLRNLAGSGPNGRIISRDLENVEFVARPEITSQDYSDQPLSNVRKLIAKAMHASLQNSAQLTHHMSADVRSLLDARQKVKNSNGKLPDITLNDMVCWCVVKALKKFPEANSHFFDDRIRTFTDIHLGLAVDTQRGLMVPAIRNAGSMDLKSLSLELKSAADACRKGNINPELIQSTSASFTVSNLGNYGVEMFTPVINLPQVAILGVCTIINRPASIGNNTFGFIPYIGLSLTYDHRAIDGGPATLFLKEIRDQIEAFSLDNNKL
jgi:pyruvate dehydrogenase E2 component (dihydrolipoamide acetyltransferase)